MGTLDATMCCSFMRDQSVHCIEFQMTHSNSAGKCGCSELSLTSRRFFWFPDLIWILNLNGSAMERMLYNCKTKWTKIPTKQLTLISVIFYFLFWSHCAWKLCWYCFFLVLLLASPFLPLVCPIVMHLGHILDLHMINNWFLFRFYLIQINCWVSYNI